MMEEVYMNARNCTFRTKRRIVHAVAVLVQNEFDQVATFWHKRHGFWTIPIGSLEPGENSADAAIREAREELGIKVVKGEIVAHCRNIRTNETVLFSIFHIAHFENEVRNTEPNKHDALQFFSIENLSELHPVSRPTEYIRQKLMNDRLT